MWVAIRASHTPTTAITAISTNSAIILGRIVTGEVVIVRPCEVDPKPAAAGAAYTASAPNTTFGVTTASSAGASVSPGTAAAAIILGRVVRGEVVAARPFQVNTIATTASSPVAPNTAVPASSAASAFFAGSSVAAGATAPSIILRRVVRGEVVIIRTGKRNAIPTTARTPAASGTSGCPASATAAVATAAPIIGVGVAVDEVSIVRS